MPLHLCGGFLSALGPPPVTDSHYIALGERLRVPVKFLSYLLPSIIVRQAPCVYASEEFQLSCPIPSHRLLPSHIQYKAWKVGGFLSVLLPCPQTTAGWNTCTSEGSLSLPVLPPISLVSTQRSLVLRRRQVVYTPPCMVPSGFLNSYTSLYSVFTNP